MKNIFILFITILLLLTSCNGEKASPSESPLPSASPSTVREVETIVWGYGHGQGGTIFQLHSDSEIVTKLGSKFDVIIKPMLIKEYNINLSTPPDFFAALNAQELYDLGVIRSIPRDMIEQYAPNYAALLDRESYGWELNMAPEGNSYLGLNTYNVNSKQPNMYSVYRLDWLESLGIVPNGMLTALDDEGRFFFTDKAFTQDQFFDIICAFANNEVSGAGGTGIYVPTEQEYIVNYPLAGMFGLNNEIMNCNGRAVPYYASEQYRDYMRFLTEVQKEGLLLVVNSSFLTSPPEFACGQLGWTILSTFLIHNYDLALPAINNLFSPSNNPDAKLLVTPPEIGLSGMQGMSVPTTSLNSLNQNLQWLVSMDVNDTKLSVILQIFDAVSFDPELFALARYGVESVDYQWEGEPYNSRVIQSRQEWMTALSKGAFAFYTFIVDGTAGKPIYDYGSNALTEYASSPAAARLFVMPYKDDVLGKFAKHKQSLDLKYAQKLVQVKQEFYTKVVTGQIKDIDSEWDSYINDLNNNGLLEYLELFGWY